MDLIKQKRLRFIYHESIRKGWKFGDNSPFFVEVMELMDKIEAKTMKEYMKKLNLERKKYEENVMRNNVVARL